jgi:probable rRNA maturation factor
VTPEIVINGRVPSSFGFGKRELKAATEFFAARSRERIGNPVWHEVVIHLVYDAGSDETHRAIMGIEGATDVVTQAYDSIPPEEPGLYGELFVNVDQALRVAPKRKGWSATKELLLYVAHGMDHLSGADDHSEKDYRAMRRRELGWLSKLNRKENVK